jgi:hypothetical protein
MTTKPRHEKPSAVAVAITRHKAAQAAYIAAEVAKNEESEA